MREIGQRLVSKYPTRFRLHETKWDKFPDGTDNIEGFSYSLTHLLTHSLTHSSYSGRIPAGQPHLWRERANALFVP